ncbi:MAG: hypothetical protein NTY46_04680 [Candidatus Sumerlaeota bacterium]|nr:hypothetical protein [Candidatus Sumerlaeota bacterium]
MNEQTEQYVRLMKKHLDKIIIGVLFVILLVMIGLWFMEQSGGGEMPSGEGRVTRLKDVVAENPDYKAIAILTSSIDMTSVPLVDEIRRFNMFDPKTMAQRRTSELEATKKHKQAQDAEARGQTDEAIKLAQQALAIMPAHRQASEMVARLIAKPEGGAEAKPTSGTQPLVPVSGAPPPPAPLVSATTASVAAAAPLATTTTASPASVTSATTTSR